MSEKTGRKVYKKSIFFQKKPSVKGLVSIVLGIICVLIIIAGLVYSYLSGGEAGKTVGSMALTALLVSCVGLYFAFSGFKEDEKNYLPCKIGVIWCGCVAVFVIFLFFIGL